MKIHSADFQFRSMISKICNLQVPFISEDLSGFKQLQRDALAQDYQRHSSPSMFEDSTKEARSMQHIKRIQLSYQQDGASDDNGSNYNLAQLQEEPPAAFSAVSSLSSEVLGSNICSTIILQVNTSNGVRYMYAICLV